MYIIITTDARNQAYKLYQPYIGKLRMFPSLHKFRKITVSD